MPRIIGKILIDDKELKRSAYKRKKDCIEESVKHSLVGNYKKLGWEVVRESKTRTRINKPKSPDVLFEDRVWMIFYNLGFYSMNKDRNLKLKLKGYTKQIDVIARDDNNVFIIECKSTKSDEPVNARNALEYLHSKRQEIYSCIRTDWGHDCGRINIIVALSSQEKRKLDEKFAEEIKNDNIFLWSSKEISYIEDLIRNVGQSAKYQLYSVIFAGKRQKDLKKEYLALRSKIAGRVFYSFMISAKEFLSYAYIHHRKLTGIIEASQAYQRMLQARRLKQIKRFIDEEEGYFPNNIIVNFSKKLDWTKKESFGNIALGTVTLPEYYGCAWIVDGQHRLYGAASANKDIVIPVLAFEEMKQKEQASLFIDINEKQKKVPKELLWDLYSDIYRDSSDENQKFLYQITETAKILDNSEPLKDCIDIPSISKPRHVKLSLTTVCSTIQKYSPWEYLKHMTNETKTPENAAILINSYFDVLKSIWPEDWNKGNKGVLLSNSGFGVFMMLFKGIVNHIVSREKRDLLNVNRTDEFKKLIKDKFLKPVIEFLKTAPKIQNDIKSQSGRGEQSDNTGILELKIKDFVTDYWSPRISESPEISNTEQLGTIQTIEEKSRISESILRNFVLEKLKLNYGDKWWKTGIPVDLKQKADKMWENKIRRLPYLQKIYDHENERKFEFFGLGEMIKLVFYSHNWDEVFKDIFLDKMNFQRRIKDIVVLRNPCSHKRNLEDQDVIDGIGGLLWLSNCIATSDLNPFV